MKINEIILKENLNKTKIDGIIYGDIDQECTGIVVTFMATQSVLKKAVALGANLIISHEGIFYSHQNEKYIGINQIADKKMDYLKVHNLVVYRYHDQIHREQPDLITEGLVKIISFPYKIIKISPHYTVVELDQPQPLAEIRAGLLTKVRGNEPILYGNKGQAVQRICVLVGYRGGADSILPIVQEEPIDLFIYGEGPEWEVPYFILDYNELSSKPIAAMSIGHENSEENGMILFSNKIGEKYPNLVVEYLPTGLY